MDIALEILLNSFLSTFFLSFKTEVVWFSRLLFQPETIWSATFLAMVASVAAYGVNYLLGWLLARQRENMPMENAVYEKGQRLVRRYFIWLLLIPWLPLLPAFSFIMAFFRPGLVRFLAIVLVGRLLYYGYYLQDAGLLT